MTSMPNLSRTDQQQAHFFGQQAAEWLRLFDCVNPSVIGFPDEIREMDHLEIIGALHHMSTFTEYVRPFINDNPRITAFEDATATAVYAAIVEQQEIN